ncbi:hypothetical protein ACVWWG_002915 [Bradyrhizobium sp. LB7.2]
MPEQASPWEQARAVPKGPLREAAVASGEPKAAAWARAAAELRRAAVWEPGAPRAVPEAAHAVAEPQPAAAKAASARQAAVGASDGPQVAVAALLGAAVRRPAEAPRADGAVQLRAAVRPGARAPPEARPLVVPSAAASVFRQGRFPVAAPAQPRAALRFAHAMPSLPIASRSEPWWQAARNED